MSPSDRNVKLDYEDDEEDLVFTEDELTGKNMPNEHEEQRPSKLPASNANQEFEEVDLEFTDQEMTRKNSFDFVIDEKKHNDDVHDLLHGKPEPPRVAVPTPTASGLRREVLRRPEEFEMTDFSEDLEAGLGPKKGASKKSVEKEGPAQNCVTM